MGKEGEEEKHEGADAQNSSFKLVGFANFVRTNPRSDRFPVKRFHHLEFWSSDATNAALRFSWGLGMPLLAKSDLSTGNLHHSSYLLRSGRLSFLFSSPYSPTLLSLHDSAAAAVPPPIPSFSAAAARSFVQSHGLGVRAVAIEVADAVSAFEISVAHGAEPSSSPTRMGGRDGAWLAEVRLYGNVVLRYVSFEEPEPVFLPGFEAVESYPLDYGILRLDHAVGNVTSLAEAVEYVKGFTGFHEFAEFTAEDVGTAESALNSVVLASNDEMVLLPMNEPVFGKNALEID
ncbi:4-hydroxyphenylpyruvate dioxygenase [Asimina triloba]